MSKWYKKCMPQIKNITPSLFRITEKVKKIPEIKNIYICGDYAKYKNKPETRIKNIDIIASTNLFSEDLLAIDKKILEFVNNIKYLEKEGYDPKSVKFSRDFTNINNYNAKHWCISNDNKLLHWGAISTNKKETEEIEKDAEKYAEKITGSSKVNINTSSETTRLNWYNCYKQYINSFFSNMPSGWYILEDNPKEILKKAIKMSIT